MSRTERGKALSTNGATIEIDDTATYAAFYISNLRTGVMNQHGIVSGAVARTMLARSSAPERLRFNLLEKLS